MLALVMASSCNNKKEEMSMKIEWSDEIVMPDINGKENYGTAGAYIGINNNHLLIAGGAFFPDGLPWRGGKKFWSKDVYALDINSVPNTWKVLKDKLPQAIAYGSSVSTPKGILCIGGNDAEKCYDNTYLMTFENDSIIFTPWQPLPYPLANCCAAIVDNMVYVAGGQKSVENGEASHVFLSIDIDHPENGWQELPAWDGKARGYAVAAAKNINGESYFYLFSGRNYGVNIEPEVLTDGYVYNARTSEWKQLKGNYPLMAATGNSIDNSGMILLAGGTDGSVFMKEMELKKRINHYLADATLKDSAQYYQNELITFFESVEGFDNIIRWFDTASNRIVKEDSIAYPMPLTTTMVASNQSMYIVSGETRPGVRTPNIIRVLIKN